MRFKTQQALTVHHDRTRKESIKQRRNEEAHDNLDETAEIHKAR